MSTTPKKKIVVCGDLVWDTHIARLPSDPKGYYQPHGQSQLINRYGGAWYLKDVIEQALAAARAEADAFASDLRTKLVEIQNNPAHNPSTRLLENLQTNVDVASKVVEQFEAEVLAPDYTSHENIEEVRGHSAGIAKGFSVWEWFDGEEKPAKAKARSDGSIEFKWKKDKALPGTWRIKEFLGCQAAVWNDDPNASLRCPKISGDTDRLDLLVIDDLGLGFAEHEPCWSELLKRVGAETPILIKGTPPFNRLLWMELLKRADNLTVVLAAAALRDAGANLSRGYSWDKTIQEIKNEFRPGGIGSPLLSCRRVIVTFGRSGTAVFSRVPRCPEEVKSPPARLQFERFVFDPLQLEDSWSSSMPGATFGTASVLTAAVAVSLLADPSPSSHLPMSRGLAAARHLHRIGGGQNEKQFNLRAADDPRSAIFSTNDLVDASHLALQLKTPEDEVSRYIRENRLDPATLRELDLWDNSKCPPRNLIELLLKTLTSIVRGENIWGESRFKNLQLRPEAFILINASPVGVHLARLNRVLLEDAYPSALRKTYGVTPAFEFDVPPETEFRSAFPRELLDDPVLADKADVPPLDEQTLLTDALGLTSSFLTVTAEDIVRFGKEKPLLGVPRLECGKYFTVDREEIERLNAVRNLILAYKENTTDTRPLSLAVFGPPGAGKSFAIKQLAEMLFGREPAVLEFNLSQFEDLESLHQAFHEVRDKSVQKSIPFVFWDEFDSSRGSAPLGWLREFLAPMQDAHFMSKGKKHPFGKCIFIFAGGIYPTFDEFNKLAAHQDASLAPAAQPSGRTGEWFKEAKAPDFISRLRGYVNIKGPNPSQPKGDEVYVIRRALMLRSLIERSHPGLIDPSTKEVDIHPNVLHAFLHVGDGLPGQGYRHGSRSMEAIVSLGRLHQCRRFGPSELPAAEVICQHSTPDFSAKVTGLSSHRFDSAEIERIADRIHKAWRTEKATPNKETGKSGYVLGPIRDDYSDPPTHPLLIPHKELPDADKENNRRPARLTPLRLEALGCRIARRDVVPDGEILPKLVEALEKRLILSEHRRWMRQKLMEGIAYGKPADDKSLLYDKSLLHKDICKFEHLEDKEKKLDHSIIRAILGFLRDENLVLIESPGKATPATPSP